jgi:Mn-containing catalase
MYHHVKKLMFTVRVDEPDPRFGNMLLEQFGGANGELAAAMQYSIRGLNCEDPDRSANYSSNISRKPKPKSSA